MYRIIGDNYGNLFPYSEIIDPHWRHNYSTLKRLNIRSEAQSEDKRELRYCNYDILGVTIFWCWPFKMQGQRQYSKASHQLSNVCSLSSFSCFLRLQSLTDCLLPARSKLSDVTVHLDRDGNSAAQVCLLVIANRTSERRFIYSRGF